jgi:hypothetical protein
MSALYIIIAIELIAIEMHSFKPYPLFSQFGAVRSRFARIICRFEVRKTTTPSSTSYTIAPTPYCRHDSLSFFSSA